MSTLSIQVLCLTAWLTACTPLAHATEAPKAAKAEFHFVILGDAQFHDPAAFNRIIDQTRQLRPAFVIQVGDLIEGYNSDLDRIGAEWQRFGQQIAPLAPVDFYAVPGNHDVYGSNKLPDEALEALFEKRWGALYSSFKYKNALFVMLNTDAAAAPNEIAGEQLTWLRKTLKSRATHKFVFMHRPPFLLKNARELHELFQENDVANVFYGHHHHYHFSERDGVAYTMTNAAANSAQDEPAIGGFDHLIQVAVRDAEVNVAVIDADAIRPRDIVAPIDNYDYFALHQRLLPKQLKLTQSAADEAQFKLQISLNNTSERSIEVFARCDSADNRWSFNPKMIAPIAIDAGSRYALNIQASYSPQRQPESVPTCHFKVPFQTQQGLWIEYAKSVTTQR